MKYTTPNDIELRSEEVQEILGKPPKWLIRYGIMLIFIIIAGLFIGSYFFKYPDILQATITVTTENLPAGVTAKTSGRLDTVFVSEKQEVIAGEMLACIENPARLSDVMALREALAVEKAHSSASLSLGDLHPSYLSFQKALQDYLYFVEADYHNKKIAVIEKQMATSKAMLQKAYRQLSLNREQLKSAHKLFEIDSSLFQKKVLTQVEYENARAAYLQNRQSFESAQMGIDNQRMAILQAEQNIFDLRQQRVEQENTLRLALTTAKEQLQVQIKTWEQNYLLIAPCSGVATFTKYWQQNQNVSAGEVVVTVVPKEKTKIIGKILLPPQGAGKVKEGQTVNVKFDNFPYMEYGMIKVTISHISLVPIDLPDAKKAYVLEVVFPDKLCTTYGKELSFSQEMTGTAEIVTEDLRLLDKFINPIKAVMGR
jgi:multidrug resistance efflux pump